MIRNFDELKNYLSGLDSMLIQLGNTPVDSEEAYKELYKATKFLTSYLADTIDSVEAKIRDQDENIRSLTTDGMNYSSRSMQLINDIRMLNARMSEFDELKGQVDNLTNIILRSLKDIPVKGGDETDVDTSERYPFKKSYSAPHDVEDVNIIVPDSFTGDIFHNARCLYEGKDYAFVSHNTMTKTKTIHITRDIDDGDTIYLNGEVSEEQMA